MTGRPADPSLPTFDRAPVVEVALAAQYEPLGLRTVDFGRILDAFRDDYPTVAEVPMKPPMVVQAGPTDLRIELSGGPVKPNLQLSSANGDRLIQIQDDRLAVNWRRRPDEDYPRYEQAVRPMFTDAWSRLGEVAAHLEQTELRPNVCEVTYVNVIDSGDGWKTFGEIDRVIAPWSGGYSDDYLSHPEELRLNARYRLPDEAGWLSVDTNLVHRIDDGLPALIVQLSARGEAHSQDLAGVLAFLDLGRSSVVQAFVSFTDDRMHDVWQRKV